MKEVIAKYWLWVVSLLSAIGLAAANPIFQREQYHAFAEDHAFLMIPHFLNVMTNLPFVIIGLVGLNWWRKQDRGGTSIENAMITILLTGILLTGLGSAFYHWNPNNSTLLWDRLPMTLVFSGLFCLVVSDFMKRSLGETIYKVYLPFGLVSVLVWYLGGDVVGGGDLRLYAFVQFFPILVLPIILIFYKGLASKRPLWWMAGWYILAKFFELFDGLIGYVSDFGGHPIKHLCAAAATLCILFYVQRRKQINKP